MSNSTYEEELRASIVELTEQLVNEKPPEDVLQKVRKAAIEIGWGNELKTIPARHACNPCAFLLSFRPIQFESLLSSPSLLSFHS